MTTATLKFKRYGGNHGMSIVNNNHSMQAVLLNIMLWSAGALVLFYFFLLGNTVFNIVARKSIETNSRVLSSDVGQMELQYIALSNKVNLTLAQSMGFQETKIKYATAKNVGSLKISNNEL
ncbi:MAG: hypothetical protein V4439_01335 [Patescibacteria group bacterium]